jgi:opacity protein-like surface antigen
MRRFAALSALPLALAAAAPALAADGAPLPVFARAQDPASPSASRDPSDFWKGFSYGVEAIGVSGRGIKGGVGGAADVAWRKALDDRLSVQFKTSAGYMPGVWKASPWAKAGVTGANFVVSEASVAYEIGRLRPWASVGAGYAKATRFGGFNGGLNALNDMASERGKGSGFVTVGAGVDYAVTNTLTLGVAVHGVQAR